MQILEHIKWVALRHRLQINYYCNKYIYMYVCIHVDIYATVRVVGVVKLHGAQTVIAVRVAIVGSVAFVNASRTKQHVSRPFMKRNVQRFQHLSIRSNIRSRKALTQVGPYEEKVSYMLYIASPSQDGTQRAQPNGGTLTTNIPTSELARLVTPMRAACIHT